jgi:hypothetical protein
MIGNINKGDGREERKWESRGRKKKKKEEEAGEAKNKRI